MLEKDLGPFIGDLPIQDITAPLLLMALRKIEARGAVETAHRARRSFVGVSLCNRNGQGEKQSCIRPRRGFGLTSDKALLKSHRAYSGGKVVEGHLWT